MNTADVAKTHAVQPGSRVTWRYKFGGTPAQLDAYEKWLLPQLKPEHRWYGLEQDEGALGKSLERSQQFLLLSALLTLLLAVAAVAVAMGLLPQPLRSGGDPQNPGAAGAAAQADCRPVADAAGSVGADRRNNGAAV
jgi:hypothetical protein